jgi:MFS family permease
LSRNETFASVLRIRQFFLFAIGQTISQLGDQLDHMALIGLIGTTHRGGSGALALAQLAVFFTLPVILFGPVVGVLIDRWNKKKTLIACDSTRAVLVVLIPFAYAWTRNLLSVYVLVFFVFLLGLFFNSAKMAIIPDLVARRKLLSANSVNNFIGRFATVIGMVFGGLIVGWYLWQRIGWQGYAVGFYLDGISYAVSVLTLSFVIGRTAVPREPRYIGAKLSQNMGETLQRVERVFLALFQDLREVYRLIRRDRRLFFVLAPSVLLAMIGGSVYVLVIVIVQSQMNWGTKGIGFLGGITAGGMILGSLLIGTFGTRWDKRQTILMGFALIGAVMASFARSFTFVLLAPLAFIGGAILAPVMISQDTLLHEIVPQEARGRIFTTREIIQGASFILTAVVIAILVILLPLAGAREPYRVALFALGALVFLIAGIGVTILRRRIRRSPQTSPIAEGSSN